MMNLPPHELRIWANQRLQEMIVAGQKDFAYQRKLEQQLGKVLRWLGAQFTQLVGRRHPQAQKESWNPARQAPC